MRMPKMIIDLASIKAMCEQLRREMIANGEDPEIARRCVGDLTRTTGRAMKEMNWHGPIVEKLITSEDD